jgi:protein SMG6
LLANNKGLKYIGLALVSAQKLFLFLGDLARYSEQINETQNYTKAKQWYLKAQQVVPKNGRPYNQLALLSVYSVS